MDLPNFILARLWAVPLIIDTYDICRSCLVVSLTNVAFIVGYLQWIRYDDKDIQTCTSSQLARMISDAADNADADTRESSGPFKRHTYSFQAGPLIQHLAPHWPPFHVIGVYFFYPH